MRSKYNYGELVKVSGIGKEFGKVENKLGFIIRKDDFYDDYYIDMLFGERDWFSEDSLERVLGEKIEVTIPGREKGFLAKIRNIFKNI